MSRAQLSASTYTYPNIDAKPPGRQPSFTTQSGSPDVPSADSSSNSSLDACPTPEPSQQPSGRRSCVASTPPMSRWLRSTRGRFRFQPGRHTRARERPSEKTNLDAVYSFGREAGERGVKNTENTKTERGSVAVGLGAGCCWSRPEASAKSDTGSWWARPVTAAEAAGAGRTIAARFAAEGGTISRARNSAAKEGILAYPCPRT